jgi:hypothetical protein
MGFIFWRLGFHVVFGTSTYQAADAVCEAVGKLGSILDVGLQPLRAYTRGPSAPFPSGRTSNLSERSEGPTYVNPVFAPLNCRLPSFLAGLFSSYDNIHHQIRQASFSLPHKSASPLVPLMVQNRGYEYILVFAIIVLLIRK